IWPSSTPSCLLASAALFLMRASAAIWADSRPEPEIGKFSTARWVCAAYSAFLGTRTSPIVSCSMRKSVLSPVVFSDTLVLLGLSRCRLLVVGLVVGLGGGRDV